MASLNHNEALMSVMPSMFMSIVLAVLQVMHHGGAGIGRDPIHQAVQEHQ